MKDGEGFATTRDYVVLKKGFREYSRGTQLRLHLLDTEKGVYKLKNGDETFTSQELSTASEEKYVEELVS